MQITAAKLAEMINAIVEGDPNAIISAPAKIEEAGPGHISFLANPAYENYLYTTGASAVLVSKDFRAKEPVTATLLRVDDVYGTVGHLLSVYGEDESALTERVISPHSAVDESATIGKQVAIGSFSSVGKGASIGDGTVLLEQVFIGPGAKVGKNCTLFPGVRLLRNCVIGDNCVLHANVVIGGDGFGFAPDAVTGKYKKVPQVGNVVIHDDVEIGACTTIDRATMGSTVIKSGVKLDNLIQIAHNVEIGKNTVIAALSGVAGSVKIGPNCRIGGQVGIAGHCTLAAGTQIQAQSGISKSIRKEGTALGGSPHMHYPDYLRSYAMFKNLPSIISDLRKKIGEIAEK